MNKLIKELKKNPNCIDISFETSTKDIIKFLKTQMKVNRNVKMLSWVVTIYVVLTELRIKEQKLQIDILSKKIEELKTKEGDC